MPVAVTLKLIESPEATVRLTGLAVITGGDALVESRAGIVSPEPTVPPLGSSSPKAKQFVNRRRIGKAEAIFMVTYSRPHVSLINTGSLASERLW